MTKPLPFTKARVQRAIAATREAGINVAAVSIHPDGTVTVHSDGLGIAFPVSSPQTAKTSEWEDIQA
jgi:hypothetical protein